jgi:hypothetical protein
MWFFKSKQVHYSGPVKIVHEKGFPEVDNWLISEFIVQKLIPIVGWHPYPLSELQLMVGALCWYEPKYIFDWGTHTGIATRIFYETTKYFNLKTKVVSIDLPEDVEHCEHPHKNYALFVKHIPEITLLRGDGLDTAMQFIQSKKITKALFFLDGDHEYASVKRELATIHRKVKKPAILLHDTFFQGPKSGYNIGPRTAINEFLAKNKKYAQMKTEFGRPGIDFLYVR